MKDTDIVTVGILKTILRDEVRAIVREEVNKVKSEIIKETATSDIMNNKFKEEREITERNIDKKFEEERKYTEQMIDKKFEEERKYTEQMIDKKFEAERKYTEQMIDKKLKEERKITEKMINNAIDKQSKEIAVELRNVAEYICNRMDNAVKQINKTTEQHEKRITEIEKEQAKNKIEHDGYNANIYKIHLTQSNLEEKVFDLEKNKKIANS